MIKEGNFLKGLLDTTTKKVDPSKTISVSKLNNDNPEEWSKFIIIVKKKALTDKLSELGLALGNREDFAQLPKNN